jgi:ABC-type sugar transport system ATPase subunit
MAGKKEKMAVTTPAGKTVGIETINDDIAISVADLKKHYGSVEAVRGIDLSVGHGEIFGLIGPDGAGKTSVF